MPARDIIRRDEDGASVCLATSELTSTTRPQHIHRCLANQGSASFTDRAEKALAPRTFQVGDVDDTVVKGWYDPCRVSILRTEVHPINHIGRSSARLATRC